MVNNPSHLQSASARWLKATKVQETETKTNGPSMTYRSIIQVSVSDHVRQCFYFKYVSVLKTLTPFTLASTSGPFSKYLGSDSPCSKTFSLLATHQKLRKNRKPPPRGLAENL